jgi:hypothetical protein
MPTNDHSIQEDLEEHYNVIRRYDREKREDVLLPLSLA